MGVREQQRQCCRSDCVRTTRFRLFVLSQMNHNITVVTVGKKFTVHNLVNVRENHQHALDCTLDLLTLRALSCLGDFQPLRCEGLLFGLFVAAMDTTPVNSDGPPYEVWVIDEIRCGFFLGVGKLQLLMYQNQHVTQMLITIK